MYQNNNEICSVFPPTSGQIPSTSGQSDWLNQEALNIPILLSLVKLRPS